jgi:hypothetical protein
MMQIVLFLIEARSLSSRSGRIRTLFVSFDEHRSRCCWVVGSWPVSFGFGWSFVGSTEFERDGGLAWWLKPVWQKKIGLWIEFVGSATVNANSFLAGERPRCWGMVRQERDRGCSFSSSWRRLALE